MLQLSSRLIQTEISISPQYAMFNDMIKQKLVRYLILFLEDVSLKILKFILVIIVIALSSYASITDKSGAIIPYIVFFLGSLLLVTGIIELRKKRKAAAITLFLVTAFNFYVLFEISIN